MSFRDFLANLHDLPKSTCISFAFVYLILAACLLILEILATLWSSVVSTYFGYWLGGMLLINILFVISTGWSRDKVIHMITVIWHVIVLAVSIFIIAYETQDISSRSGLEKIEYQLTYGRIGVTAGSLPIMIAYLVVSVLGTCAICHPHPTWRDFSFTSSRTPPPDEYNAYTVF